ncbi:MFS family permease [Methanophagales archaeon]|nr:MFS family permease [Methanophagales archaeon]
MFRFYSNRQVSRVVLIAAICVFSTQFGVTVIAPLLGEWVRSPDIPNPFLVSGLIIATFALVSLCLNIPSGIISDIVGRKPLIVIGLLLYALAAVLFPYSMNTYDWIFVRALQGAGAGLFFPAIAALLADVTSHEERGHALSVYNIGLGVGLAAGPISGGFLFDRYGIFMPFLFCAVFAFISAVLVLFFVTKEPKRGLKMQDMKEKRKGLSLSVDGKRALIVCCIVIFFGMGVASMTSATFAPFAIDNFEIAEDLIGTILTVMFVVFVLLQVGFNRLMKRVGEYKLAIIGLLLCACGLLVLGFATSILELFVTGVFLGAGLGAISLGTLTLASKAAGKGQEGEVMGIYYTTFYASMGTIPIVCGALSDIFSVQLLFLGYAGLLFVLMFVVWRAGGSLRVNGAQ